MDICFFGKINFFNNWKERNFYMTDFLGNKNYFKILEQPFMYLKQLLFLILNHQILY